MRQEIPLLLAFVALGTTNAIADVTYNNQAQWDAVVTGITTIDFGTLNPPSGSFLTYPTPPGLTVSGVNFSGKGTESVYVMNKFFCCSTYNRGADTLNTGVDGTITATLPSGTTAVGFYLFTVTNGDVNGTLTGDADITVHGTTYVVSTPVDPNLAFFGITSSNPISTLTITALQAPSGTAADMIDFAFGGAVTTPEPGYYWVTFGFCVTLLVRRRRALTFRRR